jgi:predicted alpha/beta superfamily hydrolase
LQFLIQDVKPLIERQFDIDRKRQVLLGHSLGGLFVLHVLFTHPDDFQTYVASSPSIWWNDRSILAEEHDFLGRMTAKTPEQPAGKASSSEAAVTGHPLRLLISVGELEQTPRPGDASQRAAMLKRNRMVGNARELSERLAPLSQLGLRVTFTQFEEENHGSVVPMAISRAVRLGLRREP